MDIQTFRKIKNDYTKRYKDPTLIVDIDTHDKPIIVITHGDGKSWAFSVSSYQPYYYVILPCVNLCLSYFCLDESNQLSVGAPYSLPYHNIIYKCKSIVISKDERIVNVFNELLGTSFKSFNFITLTKLVLGVNPIITAQLIELIKNEEIEESERSSFYFNKLDRFLSVLQQSNVEDLSKSLSLKQIIKVPSIYLKAYLLQPSFNKRVFNEFKEFVPIYSREEFKKYINILIDPWYNFEDLKNKRVVEFIYNTLDLYDKTDSEISVKVKFYAGLYRDYLCMRHSLPSSILQDFRLIPKDLSDIKTLHDRMFEAFIVYNTKPTSEKLKDKNIHYQETYYNKAKVFEYENDEYVIKACENLSDLIIEGETLHHCVGSYTDSVSRGHEYILFLRKKESPDIPYFTIDLTPDKRIRQIHGLCNCNVNKEIKPFIDEWIKKFDLDGSNYSGCLCAL